MKTEDIKLFHQIVDAGSLIRAAEIFDLPKSNLCRRVKALEEELQVQLFHRHNRSMQLTEAGETFYERTKALISDFELCIQEVTAPTYELSGHLRVQVLPLPGVIDIGRAIFKFMDLYPKVTVEIITSSIETDLIENHIDVALRIGDKLEDSSLIARPFLSASFGYYATPNYIATKGMPKSPEDMVNHDFIRFRYPNGYLYNKMPLGKDKEIEVSGKLIMNSVPLVVEACLQDRGIILLPEPLADFYIERGMLVRLFEDIEPSMSFGWLVYPSRKYLSLTVRTFIDYMLTEAEHMGVCQNIEGDVRGMSI
ncbi:LysR family transcriptional regulator [Photobacterium proteolyticum]|uniref:LysR family transcriptional regulator n=1 Tax=Photobacterium proteolyticum TaxID=1903952 RepID=A0A1Q9GSI2_9GAMM|nr:LysR family transcriptional regulator [Photobacterium proteolyticum]OLQ77671.1 LysR family transcriptional regulator [Photobacterium proteolyticum]